MTQPPPDKRTEALAAMRRLLEVMARLRAECPWTKEQTHTSLSRYLIEEAHEAAHAVAEGHPDEIRDELGDVLMQVVFHAAIADSEGEGWSFADVATRITDKLVHRSPHVFADASAPDAAAVDALWQQKKAEEGPRRGPLDGIPVTLPALHRAQKVLERTSAEVRGDDVGTRILRLAAEANAAGLDAEAMLHEAIRAHVARDQDTDHSDREV